MAQNFEFYKNLIKDLSPVKTLSLPTGVYSLYKIENYNVCSYFSNTFSETLSIAIGYLASKDQAEGKARVQIKDTFFIAHNEEGPAVFVNCVKEEYIIHGQELSKDEFEKFLLKKKVLNL